MGRTCCLNEQLTHSLLPVHPCRPGAYNPPAKAITIMQQSLTEPRPFNATSNRFGSDDNGVPGPGAG